MKKSRTINDLTRELNATKVNMDDDSSDMKISSLEEKLVQYQKSLQQHQGKVQLLENSLTDHKEEIEALSLNLIIKKSLKIIKTNF